MLNALLLEDEEAAKLKSRRMMALADKHTELREENVGDRTAVYSGK
ncbi:MAG: hypothetical protein PHY16_02580 [Methylobacter sp.]|nr:hypothetical protein [Methylobacter sp.]